MPFGGSKKLGSRSPMGRRKMSALLWTVRMRRTNAFSATRGDKTAAMRPFTKLLRTLVPNDTTVNHLVFRPVERFCRMNTRESSTYCLFHICHLVRVCGLTTNTVSICNLIYTERQDVFSTEHFNKNKPESEPWHYKANHSSDHTASSNNIRIQKCNLPQEPS